MSEERYAIHVGVFLILTRQRGGRTEMLMQKRINTGYMDGRFDVACSGTLEARESLAQAMVREAKEELGVEIAEDEIDQVYIGQILSEDYLKVFFRTSMEKVKGEPKIMEEDKCADLRWFWMDELPEEVSPFIPEVLRRIEQGEKCGVL